MKSFRRKLAAFMAVVLVLTSFNMAWAKEGSDRALKFSDDSGGSYKSEFQLQVGKDATTISVFTASQSEATPAEAIKKFTVSGEEGKIKVATASEASHILTVEPLEAGDATVTVTAVSEEDKTYTGTFTVKIMPEETPEETPEVTLIDIPKSVTIKAGKGEETITVKASPSDAKIKSIDVVSDPELPSDNSVSVNKSADGKTIAFEAKADAEEATYKLAITAEAELNGKTMTTSEQTMDLIVEKEVVVGEMVLSSANITLDAGKHAEVTVSVKEPSTDKVTELSAKPSKTDVVDVSVDKTANVITITAMADAPDTELDVFISAKVGGKEQNATIHVTVKKQKVDDKVTGIEISFNGDNDSEYYVGQTIVATAQLNPAGAKAEVTWEASGIEFEKTVNKDGSAEFYAKTAGTLTVKATAGGISNSKTVEVNRISAKMAFEEKSVVLSGKGDTYNFEEKLNIQVIRPATGNLHDELEAELREHVDFYSSDKEILNVDENGLGTAAKPGIVTVTAKVPANNLTATCKVEILNDNTYQVVLDKAAMEFEDVNLIQKIAAKVYLVEDGKDPVEVTDLVKEEIKLNWTSSDTNIVTIDTIGMITAKSVGTAKVTVNVTDKTGKVLASQECAVTVKKTIPIEDGAVVDNYKKDAAVEAVLNAEDPSKVTKDEAKAAAAAVTNAVTEIIEKGDSAALLKNETETAKVMDDVSKIEEVLLATNAVEKPRYKIEDSKINSIEADGLALNALAVGEAAVGMSVGNVAADDIEVPQAISGRTIDTNASVTIDIQLTGISSLTVPVRIKLGLPAGFNADNTGIIHYGARGMEIVPCKVSGGKVIFTVSDLSPFAIVKLQTTPDGGGSISGGGSSSGSGRSTSAKKTANTIPETPGFWFETAAGWQFYTPDGTMYVNTWIYVNSNWYWIAPDGIMGQGWQQINGQFYYLTPGNGAMVTGWIPAQNLWYYTNGSGAMVTGWQQINNVWYFFGQDGIMLANTTTPDGYSVDGNGAWVQ